MMEKSLASPLQKITRRRRSRQHRDFPSSSVTGVLMIIVLLQLFPVGYSKEGSKSTLVFSAQCQLESESLGDDPHALRNFLERPSIRNLFLSAGGTRSCQELSVQQMSPLWKQACERYYGVDALPSDLSSEDLCALATETEAHFPGFKTINTVVNGCQLFRKHSLLRTPPFFASPKDDDDVVYKFHLIADKKRMEGPKPVVWLVRKLTGGGESDTFQPSETRATSVVSIFQKPNNGRGVGFCLDIHCAVQIEFPSLLLKMLPAPRSTVEERGTKAIRNALEKDATAAVQAIQEAWQKEHSTTTAVTSSSSKGGLLGFARR